MGYYTSKSGYEHFYSADKDTTIHQLVLISKGADPYLVYSDGEYNTHHKNDVPWDNRPENLELLTKGEHNSVHWDPNMLMGDYITSGVCKKIRSDYKSGIGMGKLADKYDCSQKTIHMHLKGGCSHTDVDLTPNQKGPREGPWRDKEVFEQKYIHEDLNLEQMAELWDASESAMSKWKRKHDIEKY